MGKKNIGSNFDDFLAEEAILEESTAVAMKRVIARQIAEGQRSSGTGQKGQPPVGTRLSG